MQFSNTFKVIWWILLFIVLTLACIYRLRFGTEILSSDKYLFAFWCILALFPIVSEMSLLGVSLKKDIEKVKDEIRTGITEIKNTIHNNQNQSLQVINNISSATKDEIQEKQSQEVDEIINDNQNLEDNKTEKSKEQRQQQRMEKLNKLAKIEYLVQSYFNNQLNTSFQENVKFQSNTGSLILDGVIHKYKNLEDDISEDSVIEIKFIGPKSVSSLYFIFGRVIDKLLKLTPYRKVIFVVVSEKMDSDMVIHIEAEILKIKNRIGIYKNFNISAICFKFENDNLMEISTEQ